ncbi:MAG: aminotransferase class I/II-fold pyridoxal phosphate-dependent enzyme [Clostridiales bacterium]|nr:aminotransferase class I/II-fold pyridoxal phosphate-dependent enzyme [Clostridiales bacterium]
MNSFLFAEQNGRIVPMEDKIFGINRQAKELEAKIGKEAVVNATIGSLLDDEGRLVVLSSVVEVMKSLDAVDYADYAPIGGTVEFKKAVIKAAFGNFEPDCFTGVVATPGGTGAIRNTISNFSKYGDEILTSDWFWAPYSTIAQEIGRKIATYELFDGEGHFNIEAFSKKARELIERQGRLVVIINTPAHNPTGYSLTAGDWDKVVESLELMCTSERKATILVDAAYIDFAGDADEYRAFLPKLEKLPENILPIIAYSLSKTFTLYGMRSGAMICMTQNKDVADEFVRVCEFSARGTWSNCTRSAMTVLSRIYNDAALLKKVDEERRGYRDMLLRRGKAFESSAKEAGLAIVPFDAGFFASIPCESPDAIGKELQKDGIFLVPLAKGLRVSVASISEERCRAMPAKVRAAQGI